MEAGPNPATERGSHAMSLRPRRAGVHAAGPRPAAPPAGPASGDAAQPRVAKNADEARHRVPNPLLKELLGEEDEAGNADDPALSALCQEFVNKPNPYRNPAPNVDQIVGDSIVK